ncbi:unnamed protein product [Cladocopium goreaui]|uniref:ABM domain-containing protein n=1 Tax=Cladocopium goreaui TaxID=2562237 RepID=A0A9P1FH13_9DINO|nr:unnamed protein product [Cladocopium goreaui]|mmetsp:Transcript_60241/g.131950  ORF Transcript_60241/g.131950 Transcript_60241/m.131950 type:complete len:162 (-) Transcript_60241:160-645(-)
MVVRSLLRRVRTFNEWWEDLDLAEIYLLYMAGGMYWGTCYGTYCRRAKLATPESDYLLVSVYHVDEDKKKGFEASWSDQARLAQRQPGYEWTKTFKAIDWSESPFHYITFRMWNESSSYLRMVQFDPTWKELVKRLKEVCAGQKDTVYRILVDDSVKRIIE